MSGFPPSLELALKVAIEAALSIGVMQMLEPVSRRDTWFRTKGMRGK